MFVRMGDNGYKDPVWSWFTVGVRYAATIPTHVICASVLEMYMKIRTGVSLVYLLFLFILIFILLIRKYQGKFKMYGKYNIGDLGLRW